VVQEEGETLSAKATALRVYCHDCGPRMVKARHLCFSSDGVVVTGWYFRCPSCDEIRHLDAAPDILGLLHHLGVRGVRYRPTTRASDNSDHRQVVSFQIMLDDPMFLPKLAATSSDDVVVPLFQEPAS
jgi:hypothetical protein